MAKINSNAQTGALTLVLLVKSYKSQMVALLVKNGIVVSNDASDDQVVKLMANLLKVSKSYFQDLNNFVTNPAVVNVITGGFEQTNQYLKMTGDGYMNVGGFFDYTIPESPFSKKDSTTKTDSTIDSKPSFWGEMKSNVPNWISDGIKLLGQVSNDKANTAIANSQKVIAESGSSVDPNTGKKTDPKDEGMSITSIVLLSLLGVAVLGTAIYFVVKQKK